MRKTCNYSRAPKKSTARASNCVFAAQIQPPAAAAERQLMVAVGFNPRDRCRAIGLRRVATPEGLGRVRLIRNRRARFVSPRDRLKRRSATRVRSSALPPWAESPRLPSWCRSATRRVADFWVAVCCPRKTQATARCRGAAIDGSRGFQPTGPMPRQSFASRSDA
jgi:hypothetical protein